MKRTRLRLADIESGSALDVHGQPLNRHFNAARLSDRALDEMMGLCRGIVADGRVVQTEAEVLRDWIELNREYADHWPANVIYSRLADMLQDGVLDAEEEAELLDLLQDLVGGGHSIDERVAAYSSRLPLDRPEPELVFRGRLFCMTGKFVFGTRKEVEATVRSLGAETNSAPTQRTTFLVIGAIGSEAWIHSTHGRKIEKAVQLREKRSGIAIVSEEHWTKAIQRVVA